MTEADVKEHPAIPSHVPRELIWDHDLTAFAGERDDPFESISRLYDGPTIVWARGAMLGTPGWLPTRFAPIQDALMDARRFSTHNAYNISDMLNTEWKLIPNEIDPPEHMGYRVILQKWFQPSALARFEDMVRATARELIANFQEKGECEFVSEFGQLFPSMVFVDLMGLPREMVPQFLEWHRAFARSPSAEERAQGLRDIEAYLKAYIARKREAPAGDLVSVLVTADVKGRPLSDLEVLGLCFNLYLGGLDTVAAMLGWCFRHLARDQELQARLRSDLGEIPGAVEDFLRAFGIVLTSRTITEDLEFHGVEMKKGDRIFLQTAFASRDPSVFEDPHRIDPDRKAKRYMTFGTGVHNCLGLHLAKRELNIVIEEWLSSFSRIEIQAGLEPILAPSDIVWMVAQLPLAFSE